MEDNLSQALSNSISEETQSVAAELMEAGLDSVMDDGLLKEVPILSVAVSLYKIGHSIKERYYLRKLAAFINALNKNVYNEEERNNYKRKISDNPKQRDKELEYILILIDRYIHSDKADKLAKLYLVYLDGKITWSMFSKYAEILDRLLPGDYEEMHTCSWPALNDSDVSDSLLRLISLGLVISHDKGATFGNTVGELALPDPVIKDYELTDFGIVFLRCLLGELD